MTHKEKATELFVKGYNCSQAVFGAFAEDCGINEETALKLSSSFGGGMGRLREVCGAVTAMFMVAGLLKGYSEYDDKKAKDEHYRLVQTLAKDFEKIYGTYICRDLLKTKDTAPVSTVRSADFYKTRPCLRQVETCCDILEKHFFNA